MQRAWRAPSLDLVASIADLVALMMASTSSTEKRRFQPKMIGIGESYFFAWERHPAPIWKCKGRIRTAGTPLSPSMRKPAAKFPTMVDL
jgi:hypothetical protein